MSAPLLLRRSAPAALLLRPATMMLLRPAALTVRHASAARKPAATKLTPDTSPLVPRKSASAPPPPQNTAASSLDVDIPGDKLNPSLTTLPPPLELPERDPGVSTFTHVFRTGKTYLTFFKTGLKAVVSNFTSTRKLQDMVDSQHGTSLRSAAEAGDITRAEYIKLMRARHDIKRIPVFALIFIVFGEMSPFVLPFVSGVVPFTCRIPKQLERERRKRDERVEMAWRGIGEIKEWWGYEVGKEKEWWMVARRLGVEPRWVPLGLLAKRRVLKRVEYLEIDDLLVRKAGGWEGLRGGEELRMAVSERGMKIRGRGDEELRGCLRRWEALRKKAGEIKPSWWLVREGEWEKCPDLQCRKK